MRVGELVGDEDGVVDSVSSTPFSRIVAKDAQTANRDGTVEVPQPKRTYLAFLGNFDAEDVLGVWERSFRPIKRKGHLVDRREHRRTSWSTPLVDQTYMENPTSSDKILILGEYVMVAEWERRGGVCRDHKIMDQDRAR